MEHPYHTIIKAGDHIEWLSNQQTDKGPCTGTVWWIKDGIVCVKFSPDEFGHWLLEEIDFARVSLHHRTGKPLFFAA